MPENRQPNPPNPENDTQPKRPDNLPIGLIPAYPDSITAPPRLLLWGMVFLMVMGLVGMFSGIYIFRNVLRPGQQMRVMNMLPFMEAFLPPRPAPGDTLPTAAPVDADALENLLNLPLITPEMPRPIEESTPELTAPIVIETPIPEVTEITSPEPENTPTLSPATPIIVTPEEIATLAQASTANRWPLAAYNTGFRHEKQTWNNCGPANITMALSYYGWQYTQTYAAERLKPEREDKNVSPHEMVDFVNEYSDVSALARIGGDLDLLRILIANQFPVVIERGHMFGGYDWLGHYQTIIGYNDAHRQFYIYDSFLGIGDASEGIIESYEELDRNWQAFNRVFIVVYSPSHEGLLMQLLEDRADPIHAAEYALSVSQAEVLADQQNAFAWFNMGTSLTELGRYEEATVAFDRATIGGIPWRMLWYQFGLFEAYYEAGRYDDVLNYASANIANGGEYVEETYYWRGRAYAAMGQSASAAEAFRMAINRNPLFAQAREALTALNS